MLVNDDEISRLFGLLHRTADALKQAAVIAQRAPPPTSPYPHLDALPPSDGPSTPPAVAAAATTSSTTSLPRLSPGASKARTSERRGDGAGAHAVSGRPLSTFEQGGGAAEALDVSCIDSAVQLPRVVGESDLSELRRIGRLVEGLTRALQRRMDAKLVEFYTHLSQKVLTGPPTSLQGSAPLRGAAPGKGMTTAGGAVSHTFPAAPSAGSGQAATGALTTRDVASRTDATTTAAAATSPTYPAAAANTHPAVAAVRSRTAHVLDPRDDLSSVLSSNGEAEPSPLHPHRSAALPLTRTSSSHALTHNAPLGRRMEEERAAAAELQSFLALLLEAAMRQTDATAAAVYLDDAGGEQTFTRTASFIGGLRGAGRPASSSSSAAAAANGTPTGSGKAQFLHCVAHVHGNFPRTISCALSNVLTTVAQTGIAVNLNYSDSAAALRPGDLSSGAAAAAAAKAAARSSSGGTSSAAPGSSSSQPPSLYLNMYNGVVMPIKGLGCLVLANRAKRTGGMTGAVPPRFGVFDEHVAWSSALLAEAVLQQYDRELLLRATAWAPPCLATLRPFMKASAASPFAAVDGAGRGRGGGGAAAAAAAAGGAEQQRRRLEARLGSRRRLPTGRTVRMLPDSPAALDSAQRDEATSLVLKATNDLFAKRLTIVRTEDTQLGKALPEELRSSRAAGGGASKAAALSQPAVQKVVAAVARDGGRAGGVSTSTSAHLTDEELFLAAAEYITNLESLWRKTISDSNSMHTMVANYDKVIQLQGEKIVHLESRVRELNAHVVQLERRNNATRYFGVTAAQ